MKPISLGYTPALGWNSWNTFTWDISEKLIMETADALVSNGYLDAGYEYLVIDDCWSLKERDEQGNLVPDPNKFPNGMKAVADYVHSKGLKFGMYSCAGTHTCAGHPGSFEHEFEDAKQFAEWGVDYLKYDYCFKPRQIDGSLLYKRMSLALKNCGRDILFSACSDYAIINMVTEGLGVSILPELLLKAVENRQRVIAVPEEQSTLIEGLPIKRESSFQNYVTIMYGCNNFCSYCIVPYVRGRERSRNPKDILKEIENLQKQGVQEIMLLGQNVNSYGNDNSFGVTFPQLLHEIGKTGIPRVRFMTSHPKDLSDELIEEMVSEAGGGGELRIYFEASVDELISGAEENRLYWTNEDGKKDFKSMRFNGDVKIAIYNPNEGSGWETTIHLDRVFPFKRENLFVSETEKWDLESSFGMCWDWLRGKDTPAMLYKSCKGAIRESKTAERNKREAELTRIFRAGGCTHGDMDMSRHRDVHYVNEVPCGSHCPHCGTFWID